MTPKEKRLGLKMGRAIAIRRQQRQFTQAELAEAIGVEQETISRFERGATLPPLGRLSDIADALSCPLDELLRTGSPRLEDRAQGIARILEKLTEPDRRLVGEIVEQLCVRLLKHKA
ncbi:anaerobic benzoate catabolism transcriptional regulator [mine drainage metagenome]|uniref:Anaerobic benzoate catabolism transcriptional regulator n=1 Tax=mine drainage metagenome TaxID=410659 RepID=A0A1J5T7I6_9ZZZZ